MKKLLIAPLLFLCVMGFGQHTNNKLGEKYFSKAYKATQHTQLKKAKKYIDMAFTYDTIRNNDQAWYLRGFIFKELYKKYESNNFHSIYRDSAVNDLMISTRLNKSREDTLSTYPTLKYLAATYYNDAASGNWDSVSYLQSLMLYEKHKDILRFMDPYVKFNKLDIQFYNVVGNIYFDKYTATKQNTYFVSSVISFSRTLQVEPDNYTANYSLERIYFNTMVYLTLKADSLTGSLNDSLRKLAKNGLPFALKAYKLNPNKDALRGLSEMYLYIHKDKNSFDEYKKQNGITE